MNLGTLQAFIQNLEAGQDRARRIATEDQAQRAMAAQVAGIPAAAPPPPMQQTPLAPAAPPVAHLAALGQNPMLTSGARPVPAAPAPMPVQAPQGPPPVDPRLSSVAQPQAMAAQAAQQPQGDYHPEIQSAIQEGQQSYRSIVADIKARNPGIDNLTLAMAAQDAVDNMKGLAPLTKATLQTQAAVLADQTKQSIAAATLEARVRMAKDAGDIKLAYEEYNANMGYQKGVDVAKIQAEASKYRADVGAAAREFAATTSAGATVDSARMRSFAQQWVQENKADLARGLLPAQAGMKAAAAAASMGVAADVATDLGASVADLAKSMIPPSNVPLGSPLSPTGAPARVAPTPQQKPTPAQVQELKKHRSNPAALQSFDAAFGRGAAARALRQ